MDTHAPASCRFAQEVIRPNETIGDLFDLLHDCGLWDSCSALITPDGDLADTQLGGELSELQLFVFSVICKFHGPRKLTGAVRKVNRFGNCNSNQFGKTAWMSELRRIREERGLKLKHIAERINSTEVSVSRYEKQDHRLTLPLLRKFAKVYDVSVAEIVGEAVTQIEHDDLGGSVRIQELDVRASCGPGLQIDGEAVTGEWRFPREIVQSATDSPADRIKIVRVQGESMEPVFRSMDRVMVDTNDCKPSPPGFFVVWDGLGQVLKRVEFIPHSSPQSVRISSVNPNYQPYERTLDEAYIQGRVLGKWQWT